MLTCDLCSGTPSPSGFAASWSNAEDLGDLDRVKRIVKLVGFVNCTDGFAGQPKVVNGASDLFAEVRLHLWSVNTARSTSDCDRTNLDVGLRKTKS